VLLSELSSVAREARRHEGRRAVNVGVRSGALLCRKTETENLISHYYDLYVAPLKKPAERAEADEERCAIRTQIKLANQRGDAAVAAEARR
jgi:hypothetical protein